MLEWEKRESKEPYVTDSGISRKLPQLSTHG
jgi:hypothetical protein